MGSPNKRILTQEERDRIMSLPKRSFKFGGEVRQGLYDETTHKFYLLTEDGQLSGKAATITFNISQTTKPKEEPPSQEQQSPESAESPSPADDTSSPKSSKKEKKEKKDKKERKDKEPKQGKKSGGSKALRAIAFILIVLTILATLTYFFGKPLIQKIQDWVESPPSVDPSVSADAEPSAEGDETEPADQESSEQNDGLQGQNEPSVAVEDTVTVMKVVTNLLPGEELTETCVEPDEISKESYEEAIGFGVRLCLADQVSLLYGDYVASYLPVGQFVTMDAVSADPVSFANPWDSVPDGYVMVTLPMPQDTPEGLQHGSIVTLSISTYKNKDDLTQEPEDVSAGTSSEMAGMTYNDAENETTIAETYTINDVIIRDLLNGDRQSLFVQYSRLGSLPTLERLLYIKAEVASNEGWASAMKPSYIRVILSQEQLNLIGDLETLTVSTSCALSENTNYDTDAKRAFISDYAETRELIDSVVTE